MAISYTALAATVHSILTWVADAHAKIELIDKDACWTHVIALTDADAARMLQIAQSQASRLADDAGTTSMLQTLQRMTRILEQRVHLGAALLQQRFSTDAALGSFSVLSPDDLQLIVRLASVLAKDRAAIARTSSSFGAHARSAAVANDQAWAAQAASLRLLTSLTQLAPPPPGSLCELYHRYRRYERPPSNGNVAGPLFPFTRIDVDALPPTRWDLGDFLISVEFWWDDKLFGATCGELGSPNCPFRQDATESRPHVGVETGNLFGPQYQEVPFCFAHDTDRAYENLVPGASEYHLWESLFLRVFVCDRVSYATQLIYEGGLNSYTEWEDVEFTEGDLMTVGGQDRCRYSVFPIINGRTLPLQSSDTPLGGLLQLSFVKQIRFVTWAEFPPAELASVLAALLTLGDVTAQSNVVPPDQVNADDLRQMAMGHALRRGPFRRGRPDSERR